MKALWCMYVLMCGSLFGDIIHVIYVCTQEHSIPTSNLETFAQPVSSEQEINRYSVPTEQLQASVQMSESFDHKP